VTEPTNGLLPPNEAGKFDEHVAATIRTAVDEWQAQNDPADPHGVSMPEYIRRALADAGLLAAQADADRQRIAIAMHLKPTAGVDSIVHWAENHVDSIRNLALDRDKVREELLPLLRQHPLSKDDVEGDNLRAGFIAKVAADVLRWYVYEMQRWEATFGKDALPHATAIIEERDALRAQLAAAVVLPSDWYDQLAVAESGHRAAAVIAQWRQQPAAASADTSPLSHALLLKGYRGFADQVDAMARKIRDLQQSYQAKLDDFAQETTRVSRMLQACKSPAPREVVGEALLGYRYAQEVIARAAELLPNTEQEAER
jgi:hypothetical protein